MIAAAACYQYPWVAVGLLVLSIPLPWMAVLIANDRLPKKVVDPHRYRAERRRSRRAAPRSVEEQGARACSRQCRRSRCGGAARWRLVAVTRRRRAEPPRLTAAAPAAHPAARTACGWLPAQPRHEHARVERVARAGGVHHGDGGCGRCAPDRARSIQLAPLAPALTAIARTRRSTRRRAAERVQLVRVGQEQVDALHVVEEVRRALRSGEGGRGLRIHRRRAARLRGRRPVRRAPRPGTRRRAARSPRGAGGRTGRRRADRPAGSLPAAPRSESNVRSPSPSTATTVQVVASGSTVRCAATPAAVRSAAAARPAGSAPTRAASVTATPASRPRWASHAAVFAPAPPGRVRIRAGTSAPGTGSAEGATRTSSATSPTTSTRTFNRSRRARPRPARRAPRSPPPARGWWRGWRRRCPRGSARATWASPPCR